MVDVIRSAIAPGNPGDVLNMDQSIGDSFSGLSIPDDTLESSMSKPHELHKSPLVVLPFSLERGCRWIFVAAQLEGDFKVVG